MSLSWLFLPGVLALYHTVQPLIDIALIAVFPRQRRQPIARSLRAHAAVVLRQLQKGVFDIFRHLARVAANIKMRPGG